MAGAQLVVLGIVIILVWALHKNKRMEGSLGKVLSIVMIAASVIMVAEGIAAAFLSSDILIGSTQGISKKFVALGGAQLFILGMVQLSLWIRREKESRNWLFEWESILLTIVILGEGLFLMGMAGEVTIPGIGTILSRTAFLAGLQLFLIAAILLGIQLFREWNILAVRIGQKRLNIIFTLLTLAIAIEALVLAYFTEPVTVRYVGSIPDSFGKLFISLVPVQLFALSLLALSCWKLSESRLDRKIIIEFFGMGSGIVLAVEGIWVLGISGETKIYNEIGGIITRTVMIAGLLLVALGMAVFLAWSFRNNWLVKKVAGSGRIDVIMVIVGLVTGIGGVALSVLSANIRISNFGNVSQRYVELAGIQLILLASMLVLMWALRPDGISNRMRRLSYMVALFMMLLIPPAILM